MAYPIPLHSIGAHVLAQITQARSALAEAPDGGPPLLLRNAEVSIAFATADALPIDPAEVVVGDTPIPPEEVQRRLQALDRKVLVAHQSVKGAPAETRGRLILRIVF